VPRESVAPLTAIPTGVLVTISVVDSEVKVAEAVILVAPAASILDAFKVMEATPLPLVSAVADVGVNTTREFVDRKETTAPDIATPSLSLRVAVAVTGVPKVTAPEERLKTREPFSVSVSVPSSVPVLSEFPHPIRTQTSMERIRRLKKDKKRLLIDFAILISFYLRRAKF
jgi:CBS domain-containing protein